MHETKKERHHEWTDRHGPGLTDAYQLDSGSVDHHKTTSISISGKLSKLHSHYHFCIRSLQSGLCPRGRYSFVTHHQESPTPRTRGEPPMMLEGPSWEAMWHFLDVPEILQRRAAAQEFNDATKYGPVCELLPLLDAP